MCSQDTQPGGVTLGWGMKERGPGVAHAFLAGLWNHSPRGVHLVWVWGRDHGIGFGHRKLEVPEGEMTQKRLVSRLHLCKYGFF